MNVVQLPQGYRTTKRRQFTFYLVTKIWPKCHCDLKVNVTKCTNNETIRKTISFGKTTHRNSRYLTLFGKRV